MKEPSTEANCEERAGSIAMPMLESYDVILCETRVATCVMDPVDPDRGLARLQLRLAGCEKPGAAFKN